MPIYEPRALLDRFEQLRAPYSQVRFFTNPECGRLREMWCAARFSLGYSKWQAPCQVEVEEIDEQAHYDFHLLSKGKRYAFQTVEVLDEGRRRGDEYKNMAEEEVQRHLEEQPCETPITLHGERRRNWQKS